MKWLIDTLKTHSHMHLDNTPLNNNIKPPNVVIKFTIKYLENGLIKLSEQFMVDHTYYAVSEPLTRLSPASYMYILSISVNH